MTTIPSSPRRSRLRALPLATLGLGLGLAPACDDPAVDDIGEISQRDGQGEGGPTFNTNVIDTSDLPAIDTQGGTLDGVQLLNVVVVDNGSMVTVDSDSLRVHEGTIEGEVSGTTIDGFAFLGSVWTFDVDGTQVSMTLEQIETSDDAGLYNPDDEVYLLKLDPDRLVYTFSYGESLTTVKTCEYDTVAGARAVLYGDIYVDHGNGDITERDHTIYFGCLSGAVGKSALHGYAPDSPSKPSVTIDEFELAVRAVRADYCGNGTSYTNVGNALTYDDRYDINEHTEPFVTEALWETGVGATCVNRIRSTGLIPSTGLNCGDRTITSCGSEKTEIAWGTGSHELWTKVPNNY